MADTSQHAGVGQRYAQALFDLARDESALDAVEKDLLGLGAALAESADLRRLLADPAYPPSDKAKGLLAVAEALKVGKLTMNFLSVLSQKERTPVLGAVVEAYKALLAAHRGTVFAEVVTALPLSAAQNKSLTSALRQALGVAPEITTRVDPALLGGMKVRVGSRLFDSSLKSKLDSLKFALKRA